MMLEEYLYIFLNYPQSSTKQPDLIVIRAFKKSLFLFPYDFLKRRVRLVDGGTNF